MVKMSIKKSLIICVLCLLVVAAAALFIHYGKVSSNVQMDEDPVVDAPPVAEAAEDPDTVPSDDEKNPAEKVTIYICSVDRTLHEVVELYASEHWDFPYEIRYESDELYYSTEDLVRLTNEKLREGAPVDLYGVPAVYTQYYIKGEYSDYAFPYEELGIDVDAAIKKADIPQYAIEDGKNAEGKIVALPYLADVYVFVYRRSVAREVWGTDDPDRISELIGGGTGKWDKFIEAAQILKKHGYYIIQGNGGITAMTDTGLPDEDPEVYKNGSVTHKWNEYMELSKTLIDNSCINPMAEDWYIDLEGNGRKVFGYFFLTDSFDSRLYDCNDGDWAVCTPPIKIISNYTTGILVNKNSPNKDLLGPLIEWITLDCSETGLQHRLASGAYDKYGKLSVVSGTVLKNVDSSRDILGGQNINPIVYDILQSPNGRHNEYSYSYAAFYHFIRETGAYIRGETDKDTAIANFIQKAGLSIPALDPAADGDIVWKDKNFERVVRDILKKPKSSIKKSDVYRITDLYIAQNNIESIEDIVHFKNLKYLDCSDNKITDISSLNTLTDLEAFYINNNQISDISVLEELTSLEELSLSFNPITDISSLEGLANLKELYIHGNNISDITSLSNLTKLENLGMRDNSISDISALCKLKKLTRLELTGNKIKDISSLEGLTNLEELVLLNNDISDITPIGKLRNLKTLDIRENQITDISSLKKLKKLETLYADAKVKDKSPAAHVEHVLWN